MQRGKNVEQRLLKINDVVLMARHHLYLVLLFFTTARCIFTDASLFFPQLTLSSVSYASRTAIFSIS